MSHYREKGLLWMTFRIVKPSNIWDQFLMTSSFKNVLKNSWFSGNLVAKIIASLYISLVAFYFITVFIVKYQLNAAFNLAPHFAIKLLNKRCTLKVKCYAYSKDVNIKLSINSPARDACILLSKMVKYYIYMKNEEYM